MANSRNILQLLMENTLLLLMDVTNVDYQLICGRKQVQSWAAQLCTSLAGFFSMAQAAQLMMEAAYLSTNFYAMNQITEILQTPSTRATKTNLLT